MQSIILGTAQWGLHYGVTNSVGRLSDDAVLAVVRAATEHGVHRLDTAPGYGDAQDRVGRLAPGFGVQTKVPTRGAIAVQIRASLEASLAELRRSSVDAVLVHDWASVEPDSRRRVATEVEALRADGLASTVGISAYDEADVASALAVFGTLDLVQMPVSVLDQRLVGSDVVATVRERGGRIQARSVFLQGAALADPTHAMFGDHPDVTRLREEGDPLGLCLGFIQALGWIDEVVLAVTSAAELEAVVAAWSDPLHRVDWTGLQSVDPWLLDPRRWTASTRAIWVPVDREVATMSFRAKLASSRLARVAALPTRAAAATSHVGSEMALASSWLVTSREHHNYTYNLTPRNVSHLSWWVAAVTGAQVSDCRTWLAEALSDGALIGHVQAAVRASDRKGLADLDVRIGRRAGWYAIIRALRPDHVVESGTDKGLGSVVIAAALLRNDWGRLTTIDINPEAGYLISGPYASVTSVVVGDSLRAIPQLPADVGLFIHDSDHSAEHESLELSAIAPKLIGSARVLSDNAHATDSLLNWAELTGRTFSYFQETPERHWYPGAGIGAAW